MEETALAADYAQVARSCARLRDRLAAADYAQIGFSNGDTLDARPTLPCGACGRWAAAARQSPAAAGQPAQRRGLHRDL